MIDFWKDRIPKPIAVSYVHETLFTLTTTQSKYALL